LPLSLNPTTPGVDFDFGPRRASLCTPDGSTIMAAVIGINTGELSDHERYRTQMGFSFPLLHDPGAQVAALYGARQEDGTVRRLVYLIDKQGTIRYGKPGMHWNEAFFTALAALG